MGKRFVIRPDVKEQILIRLKNDGVPVVKLAEEHGISPKTIYGWLSRGSQGSPSLLELGKLKRENQLLRELIGRLTLEVETAKKKKSRH